MEPPWVLKVRVDERRNERSGQYYCFSAARLRASARADMPRALKSAAARIAHQPPRTVQNMAPKRMTASTTFHRRRVVYFGVQKRLRRLYDHVPATHQAAYARTMMMRVCILSNLPVLSSCRAAA